MAAAPCTPASYNPADEDYDNKPAGADDDNHYYYNATESSSQSYKAAAAAVVPMHFACSYQSSATRRGMSPSRQKIGGVLPLSVRNFPFRVHVLSQLFEEAGYCCHYWSSLHEICRYSFRKLL